LGGTGIVGVLIVAGIIPKATDISPSSGDLAISAGIGIAIILGILGIVGVIKKLSY
jgi:hypothetical protein